MPRYPSNIKKKARLLWLSGMVKSDEEIAAQCGIKNAKLINKWREEEKWEKDSAQNLHQNHNAKQLRIRNIPPEFFDNFVVIDEAIRFLIERISQGEIKGSFSDLDKLLRLKAFLLDQKQQKKQAKDYEGMSNEELDKEIEATKARIAKFEREEAKDKKGKK